MFALLNSERHTESPDGIDQEKHQLTRFDVGEDAFLDEFWRRCTEVFEYLSRRLEILAQTLPKPF